MISSSDPDGPRASPGQKKLSLLLIGIPVALFLAIVFHQMLGPVPIGLANNNDFPRVLGPLRLWPVNAIPPSSNLHSLFYYFVPEYVVSDPVYDLRIPSTEWLIALAAKYAAAVVLPRDRFDLRLMGVIHALLMALALALCLWAIRREAPWIRMCSAAILLWMWTDVMYIQQFSTAFSDAGALAALCLTFAVSMVVLLTPEGTSPRWAVAFALTSSFLLGTKLQHVPALVPLAAFATVLIFQRAASWSARATWGIALLTMLGTTLFMVIRTPDDYRTAPAFTVVFYKLAVIAKQPDRVLAAFHMPEKEFGKYIGHFYYEAEIPADQAFRDRIRALVTPGRLAAFYVQNPGILAAVLKSDWLNAAFDVNLRSPSTKYLLPPYGDMREIDVIGKKTSPDFTLWSGLRKRLFIVFPVYPLIIFGISLLLFLAGFASPKTRAALPLWPLPSMMTFIAVACFLFSSLLDAADTARHLVLFQAATDLTILSLFLTGSIRTVAESAKMEA
jgi:hypothetical protein